MDSRQRFLEIAHSGSLDPVPRIEEGIGEEVSLEHDSATGGCRKA